MASNDFNLSSGSDLEVSEMEDYELEVEDVRGWPNLNSVASDEEGMEEAYADDLPVDEEWLKLYIKQDIKQEEALEKTL